MNISPIENVSIQKINAGEMTEVDDKVAVEEPLGIELEHSSTSGRIRKQIAVTMRTPGNDEELAAGFLFTEGIIENVASIQKIKQSNADDNRVLVVLQEGIKPVLANSDRNFYTTSSCGICGKASIDAIKTISKYSGCKNAIVINASTFYPLQHELKKQQKVFKDTGGIHACALLISEVIL